MAISMAPHEALPEITRSTERIDARQRARLRDSALFSGLEQPDFDRLLEAADVLRAEPGETVLRRGDPGESVLFLLSGRVAVESQGSNGRSVPMNVLEPGEILGEMAVLRDANRSATVTALEACEFVVIPQAEFLSLLVGHPSLAIQVLGSVADRLGRLTEVVAALDS